MDGSTCADVCPSNADAPATGANAGVCSCNGGYSPNGNTCVTTGCPDGQHDDTHRGTCHAVHTCTPPLVLGGHDTCACPDGQHDDTHPGSCHDRHECTPPLVLEGHDSCMCPEEGQHRHDGRACHSETIDHSTEPSCADEGQHAHGSLACHDDGTQHACPTGQHKHEHNLSACVGDHPCPEYAEVTDHRDHDPRTATCECEEGYSDDPDVDGLRCVEDAEDTGSCGRHRVPNTAGTACGECPDGEEEGFPGQCMPVGNCTRLGSYWPGAESGCVRAGLVAANAQCRSTCRANSADNGWGICVCDPGHVYTVAAGALFGPTNCVRRTDELCGAAPDPGTCEPGGTWNSATANCDCDDGYERSEDGQSCECATDDEEQTGYVASVLFPNPQSLFDGLRVGFVNTSSGNLTFRRRDIVTRAQGPVVFARVYDSRIAAADDFGPGWRLSLAEELLVDGDAATYIDESGARHAFAWTGTAWAASPPTPRHAATTLVFDYDGGRLATVSHDGGTLFDVERDRDGRIAGNDWRHLTATTACSAAPSTRRAGPAWPPPTTTRDASRGRTADACTNTPTLPRARRSRRIRARCTR